MSKKTWKAIERKIATFFGTVRTPLSGGNGKVTRSDTLHDILFVEAKYRVTHSAVTLWRSTKELADKENKIPVVCLAEKSKKGFWVMCHSDDLTAIGNQRELAVKQEHDLRNK